MARPTYRGWRGDRLKQLREARGYTQDQLAVLIGAQPTMISKWERNAVIPVAENVARLAEALDVSPQEFTDADRAEGSLIDLRVWSGRTRQQAAELAGLTAHRLLSIERAIVRPRPDELRRLGEVYEISAEAVDAAWQRVRTQTLAMLRPGPAAAV
jgi:transcriptional regulator with XRE-family HTH domain